MNTNNKLKNKLKRIRYLIIKDIKKDYIALLIVAAYFIVFTVIGSTVCPIKRITGIPCPGCGLTRASLLLLAGHISESIKYNGTAGIWIVGILLFLVDKYIFEKEHRYMKIYWMVAFVITIGYYIYRMTNYHINFSQSGYIFY